MPGGPNTTFTGPSSYRGQADVACPLSFNEMTLISLQLSHGDVEADGYIPCYNPLNAFDPRPPMQSTFNQRSEGGHHFRYGSDPNFGEGRFVPPRDLPTEAGIKNAMARQLESLYSQGSLRHTRAPTPIADEQASHLAIDQENTVGSARQASENEEIATLLQECPPEPPRKTGVKAEKRRGVAVHNSAGRTAPRSRKPRSKKHTNLSEEQKDENHRLSEQRRRNVIKCYYGAMKATIPGMQMKKTKGDEMEHTVKWIRNSIAENQKLERLMQLVQSGHLR
ncbi:MAG: hypothetical protein Q9224_000215 [Gallowayella concinna]